MQKEKLKFPKKTALVLPLGNTEKHPLPVRAPVPGLLGRQLCEFIAKILANSQGKVCKKIAKLVNRAGGWPEVGWGWSMVLIKIWGAISRFEFWWGGCYKSFKLWWGGCYENFKLWWSGCH